MRAVLLDLLQIIGELVLCLAPDLTETRTHELLWKAGYQAKSNLAVYVGLKFTIGMALCFLCLVCAARSGPSSTVFLLLTIPATMCGYIAPNFFLAWYAGRDHSDK